MRLGAQFNLISASSLIVGGRGRLLGYSLYESAGTPAAAAVSLYDGTSTSGQFLARVGLASSGVANTWFGPQGVTFSNGLYVGAFTGSLAGNLYFETETLHGSHLLEMDNGADSKLVPRYTTLDIANMLERILNAG